VLLSWPARCKSRIAHAHVLRKPKGPFTQILADCGHHGR
jgi:hypothetical protein